MLCEKTFEGFLSETSKRRQWLHLQTTASKTGAMMLSRLFLSCHCQCNNKMAGLIMPYDKNVYGHPKRTNPTKRRWDAQNNPENETFTPVQKWKNILNGFVNLLDQTKRYSSKYDCHVCRRQTHYIKKKLPNCHQLFYTVKSILLILFAWLRHFSFLVWTLGKTQKWKYHNCWREFVLGS